MTPSAAAIESSIRALADEAQACHLMRFFKTGPGQYGEGDKFLGLRVPQTRAIVSAHRRTATLDDVESLISSPWHEIRLAALLLLVEIYRRSRKDAAEARRIVDYYLSRLHYGNNWDLVDLVAPKILGDYLCQNPADRDILYRLAAMEGRLWHQRVAIVATWTMLCNGIYADTIRLAELYLGHTHDLIHKASGWMLREMGKRGGERELLDFLDRHAPDMPRTMLRYAIEKLPEDTRRHYMETMTK